jgi:hypothetical protein
MTSGIVANSMTQLQDNIEITRKYYERRIRLFLDFIGFGLELLSLSPVFLS